MQACRAKGLTASEVVRDFVEAYPQRAPRRAWSVPKPKLTESLMSFSLVLALASTLAASTVLPGQSVHAGPEDLHAQFVTLDPDGDGHVSLPDLYVTAGLTPEGAMGDDMRQMVEASIADAVADLEMIAAEGVLDTRYLDRVVADAEQTAAASVRRVFEEIDTNGDGLISEAEFLASSRHAED